MTSVRRKLGMLVWGLSVGVVGLIGINALAHDGGHDGQEVAVRPPGDALAITTLVRVGEGENTYESVPYWCKLGEGKQTLGAPTHGGIVEDKDGLIYFTMEGGDVG